MAIRHQHFNLAYENALTILLLSKDHTYALEANLPIGASYLLMNEKQMEMLSIRKEKTNKASRKFHNPNGLLRATKMIGAKLRGS